MVVAWTASEREAPELLTSSDEDVVNSRSAEVYPHGNPFSGEFRFRKASVSRIIPYPGYQFHSYPIPYPWLIKGFNVNAHPQNYEQLPLTWFHPWYQPSLYTAAPPHAADERFKAQFPPGGDPRSSSWPERSVLPGDHLQPLPLQYKEPVSESPPQSVVQQPVPPNRGLNGSSSSSPPRRELYSSSLVPGSVLLAATVSPDLEEMPSLTPFGKPRVATPSLQRQIWTSQAPHSVVSPLEKKKASAALEMDHFAQDMGISRTATLPQSHVVPSLAPKPTADFSPGLISPAFNKSTTRYQFQTPGLHEHQQADESVEPSVPPQVVEQFSLSPSQNETLQARSTATAVPGVTPNAAVDLLSEVELSLRPREGLNLSGAFGGQPDRPSRPNVHLSSSDVAPSQHQVFLTGLPNNEVTLVNTSESPALITPPFPGVLRRTTIPAPHKKSPGFPSLHEALMIFSIFIVL